MSENNDVKMISSPKELDALPHGSIVACITHMANVPLAVVFQRGSNNEPGMGWTTPEAIGQIPSDAVFEYIGLNGLPMKFTVLHDPANPYRSAGAGE